MTHRWLFLFFPVLKKKRHKQILKTVYYFYQWWKEIVDDFLISLLVEILPASITNLHYKQYVPQLQ